MSVYSVNRSWSDQFLPEIRRIVGGHLLHASPVPLDQMQAEDLVVLDAKDMRVAARVRRPGYARQYPHEFTIRSKVPSGAETELSKIVNGYGDWMFYGHAGWDGRTIQNWWLIDLRAFRASLIRHGINGTTIRMGDKKNPVGTCFKWFDIGSFPSDPPLVVAHGQGGHHPPRIRCILCKDQLHKTDPKRVRSDVECRGIGWLICPTLVPAYRSRILRLELSF